jgi:hypothetical protein
MPKNQKPRLVLCGSGDGTTPTFEDICEMFGALTGREETPEATAEMRADYDAWIATLPEHERPTTSTQS